MGSRTSKKNLLAGNIPVMASKELAVEIGLEEAVFLNKLHYDSTPKDNYVNHRLYEYQGKNWVYYTVDELQERLFPFWKSRKVERFIKKLRKLKLLETAYLHFKILGERGVRKLWFTVNYDAVDCLLNEQNTTDVVEKNTKDEAADLVSPEFRQNGGLETAKMAACTYRQNGGVVEGVTTPPQPTENKACYVVGTDPAISLKNNLQNIYTTNVSCSETDQVTIDDFVITEMRKKLDAEEFEEFEPHIKAKIYDYKSHQTGKGDLIKFEGALMYVKNGLDFLRNSFRRTAKVTAALDKKATANANYQESLAKKIQRKTEELDWSLRSTKEALMDRSWGEGINFDDDDTGVVNTAYTTTENVYTQPVEDYEEDWGGVNCYA